ncbi:MAG: hypothetical protein JNK02_15105 [Planctomycetes bacterium]|nr:hypothetical protein [Planctomycetota bacterium]
MRNQHDGEGPRAARRARILWRDEDTGELLWLVLTGTSEFFEDLGRQGYDLRPMAEPARAGGPGQPAAENAAGHAA